MTSRTVPVQFIRSAIEMATAQGMDLSTALERSSIPASLLADERARCTSEQVTTFVRELWQLSGDELFGLARGPVPLGTFRLVCYAVISCADLRAVARRITEIAPALPALPSWQLHIGPQTSRIDADLTDFGGGPLMIDFMLVILHRFMGWLIGQRIRLRAVELPYPRPEHAQEYDLIFGAPVTFDAQHAVIEFDTAILALPTVRDEQELLRYLEHSPADFIARRDYGTSLADQVRRLLESGLRGRWPDSDEVAQRLSISAQHVRRRLREEGTSLGEIKEELLRDAAIAALARGDSVEELSARLGFSEPSSFRRAFKRWTGATPAAYQPARLRSPSS